MIPTPKAAIVGLAGTELSSIERDFFRLHNPLGFILFARNCRDAEQIKALTADLRNCVRRENIPILIDQEGGRVARLRPPVFRECPSASSIAEIAKTHKESARSFAYSNGYFIGSELKKLGITVNCAPVADILYEGAHAIIGNRSFGDTAEQVSNLARAMCEGLLESGSIPIIKHIPGHGRAHVDSHEDLPVVDTSRETLEKTDFDVFRQLADMPWAMTAHIIYTALDPDLPATLSPKIVELIRHSIGFKGILISDDLSMKALTGSFSERTAQMFVAGCDLALHCNGNMEEMTSVLMESPPLSGRIQALLKEQGFSL